MTPLITDDGTAVADQPGLGALRHRRERPAHRLRPAVGHGHRDRAGVPHPEPPVGTHRRGRRHAAHAVAGRPRPLRPPARLPAVPGLREPGRRRTRPRPATCPTRCRRRRSTRGRTSTTPGSGSSSPRSRSSCTRCCCGAPPATRPARRPRPRTTRRPSSATVQADAGADDRPTGRPAVDRVSPCGERRRHPHPDPRGGGGLRRAVGPGQDQPRGRGQRGRPVAGHRLPLLRRRPRRARHRDHRLGGGQVPGPAGRRGRARAGDRGQARAGPRLRPPGHRRPPAAAAGAEHRARAVPGRLPADHAGDGRAGAGRGRAGCWPTSGCARASTPTRPPAT